MFLLELHRNSIPFFFEPIRTRETQTRNVFRLCFILMLVLITISFEWIIKYHINARVRLIIKHLQTYIQNTKSELNLVDDKTTFAYRTLQKKEIYRIEYDLFSMCFDDLIVFVVIWMILSPFYIFTFREFQRNRLFMFWTGFYNLGFSSWISFKQTFSLVFMTLNRSGKKSTWRCSVLNRFNFFLFWHFLVLNRFKNALFDLWFKIDFKNNKSRHSWPWIGFNKFIWHSDPESVPLDVSSESNVYFVLMVVKNI